MESQTTLRSLLLSAPDSIMDASLHNIISEEWDDEPTALQILKAADFGACYALTSDAMMMVLHHALETALKRENTTFETLVEQAVWRESML